MKTPRIIFVIGPSAVGKSRFITEILKQMPKWKHLTDSDILKEQFKVDDYVRNTNKAYLSTFIEGLPYLGTIADKITIDSIRTTPNGDGYNIIDPSLWNDLLIYALEYIFAKGYNANIFLEFARGTDKKYADSYHIEYDQTYNISFMVIKDILDKYNISIQNSLIININASLKKRFQRNQDRKEKGEHYVSLDTLKKVYPKNIFTYKRVGRNYGILSEDIPIPVYEFDNKYDLDPKHINNYFSSEFKIALEKYNCLS